MFLKLRILTVVSKKYLSLFLMLFLFAASGFNYNAMADTHIYRGRFTNTSDIQTTWDGKHLYNGRFSNTSAIMYTWDGKHLYRGRFTHTSDILLTFGAPVPVIIMLLNTL